MSDSSDSTTRATAAPTLGDLRKGQLQPPKPGVIQMRTAPITTAADRFLSWLPEGAGVPGTVVGPTLTFTSEGYLEADFGVMREKWREPICPECGEPIQWVLDMASWTGGFPTRLIHARCAWTREGFLREAERAPDAL